jgi:guanylate kinase
MTLTHKPVVYIISAPSGSGKSTLTNELLKLVPNLDFSISYTTRAVRGSEQDGKHYHFVKSDVFQRMVQEDEFLEHATVHGNSYGTAQRCLRDAERNGHDLLLDIDVQGAAQIKAKLPDAVSIFVLPPDRKTLEWRLRNRSEDPEDVIQRRLMTASREIEEYDKYDYVLINDKLEESCESLRAIVLWERIRRSETQPSELEKKLAEAADGCRLANVRQKVHPIIASFSTSAPSARG